MAGENFKIDVDEMKEKEKALESAITRYKDFESPFETEIGYIETMNTDFLAKFKTMLENLNNGNSKTIKLLEEVNELTRDIVDNFVEIDHSIASSLEKKEG